MKHLYSEARARIDRQQILILAILLGSLVSIVLFAPREQMLSYHNFADTRTLFSIPNFNGVISNLSFLLVGVYGLIVCLTVRPGKLRPAWLFLFAGVTLVGVGSAYYHWNPNNDSLVWDRLPMTVGFMGLLAALVGEYADQRIGRTLLLPMVLFGVVSVAYWRLTGDLRIYIWVQAFPLIILMFLPAFYRSGHSHQWFLLIALGFYGLAKVSELFDADIFEMSGNIVSGHTLKHLLSAAGCFFIAEMLRIRHAVL